MPDVCTVYCQNCVVDKYLYLDPSVSTFVADEEEPQKYCLIIQFVTEETTFDSMFGAVSCQYVNPLTFLPTLHYFLHRSFLHPYIIVVYTSDLLPLAMINYIPLGSSKPFRYGKRPYIKISMKICSENFSAEV